VVEILDPVDGRGTSSFCPAVDSMPSPTVNRSDSLYDTDRGEMEWRHGPRLRSILRRLTLSMSWSHDVLTAATPCAMGWWTRAIGDSFVALYYVYHVATAVYIPRRSLKSVA
jgi:hypothetical protein